MMKRQPNLRHHSQVPDARDSRSIQMDRGGRASRLDSARRLYGETGPAYGRGGSYSGYWDEDDAYPAVAPGGRPPRRKSRLRRLSGLVLFVALLGGAAFWMTHSPYFTIQDLRVQGNQLVSTQAILGTAGLAPGMNLWRTSTRSVRERLAGIPAIADVHLVRLPPHRLIVAVQERKPWAAIQAGGRCFLVDSHYQVFAQVTQRPENLPVVIVAAPRQGDISPAGPGTCSEPVLAGLRCLALTGDPSFGKPAYRAFIDAKRIIWLNVNGFGRVRLGPAAELGPKLAVLRTLVQKPPAELKKAQFLDLENPDAPAYVPQPDNAAAAGTGASGRTAAGKPAAGKTAAGKTAAGKTAAGKPAAGKPAAGKTAAGKTAAGKLKKGKPSTHRDLPV